MACNPSLEHLELNVVCVTQPVSVISSLAMSQLLLVACGLPYAIAEVAKHQASSVTTFCACSHNGVP